MRARGALLAASIAAAVAAAVLASGGAAARPSATTAADRTEAVPVASLDPDGTAREWRRLVANRPSALAQASCRPLRGVFYAATDWLRLATKLAANASPCAQYYVSIPALVSDKTKPRPDQAWRVRALGPNFHAMAEIHWTTWSRWVASTGSTWYDAGVEARRRMAAAGYDVAKGDIWAVNEFPSSVRAIAGADRAAARELVRGLYEGDGGPAVRGTVFVIGVGQRAGLVLYQNNLQNWLTDAAFWTDMAARVSDWSQEVYSDFRSYGVTGAPSATRRDYLNDYLQHPLYLAGVGPPAIDAARAFLQSTYSPLANAAWQWGSGYGWTLVAYDQMQAFVSAQTYALRAFSTATGQAQDHWGFAWQPRNATGLPRAQFNGETAAILDRLGAAIRDSGQTMEPEDPGGGACGPPGQPVYCGGDLPGAAFTESWKSFRAWTQPTLVFATPPQTLPVATPSGPISLALQTTTGAPHAGAADLPVTLSSSSPQGQFALDPAGPWTSTLVLTIPAGGSAAGPFYYQDTLAGSAVITASAAGITSGTQTETILPGPLVEASVRPETATVAARGTLVLTATGVDQYGNAVADGVTWTVSPAELGQVRPQTGGTTTFTAGPQGGTGTITATVTGATGPLSADVSVTVRPGRITVGSIRYGIGRKTLLVSATVINTGRRPIEGAVVRLIVRRNGYRYFLGERKTGVRGKATFRLQLKKGCYRTTLIRVTAPGYVWRPATPANRFCRK
jgi:hypothetical protein